MLNVVKFDKMISDKNGYGIYKVVDNVPTNASVIMKVSEEIGIGVICYNHDGLRIGGQKLWLSSGGNYGEIIPTHPLRDEILKIMHTITNEYGYFDGHHIQC